MAKIDSSEFYVARTEAYISSLRDSMKQLPCPSRSAFDACMEIGGEYADFITDSASLWYCRAADIAELMEDRDLYYRAELYIAGILVKTGYFLEASDIIDALDVSVFSEDTRRLYYQRQTTLYHSLYLSHPKNSKYRELYVERYNAYRDTLLSCLPQDRDVYMRECEKIAGRSGNYAEAMRLNDLRMKTSGAVRLTHQYALITFDRYMIYHNYMQLPLDDHVEYILESAISDVYSANRNIASLRYVESYLISMGDISRAKRVSSFYFSTLMKFGSRTRLLEGFRLSMQVNDEYSAMLVRQRKFIILGMALMAMLVAVLVLVLVLVFMYVRRTVQLNRKLELSNKVARGYVLGFFDLYSANMAHIQSLRSRINVNLRRGNTDYILSLTDPSKDVAIEELRQLYTHFDDAFLGIYPGFVEDFNSMLRPECRIVLRKDEKLNMELRIFAIIKLGISDSAQIAQLLHCSIKTVYNKRSEINGKLSVTKEEFLEKLLGF